MSSRPRAVRRARVGVKKKVNSNTGQVDSKIVGEVPDSGQKLCPNERLFKITEEEFEKNFKTPLATIFSHLRELRNDMVSSPDLQEKHKEVIEKINKVGHDTWDVHRWTPLFAGRLRIQSQKLKKASVKTRLKEESPSKPKGAARKEAGKKKAGSLALWMQACKDASSAAKAQDGTCRYSVRLVPAVATDRSQKRLAHQLHCRAPALRPPSRFQIASSHHRALPAGAPLLR